jgi:hypothetical protein
MKNFIIVIILFSSIKNLFSQAPIIQWQNIIGGESSDVAVEIQPTVDGGYIMGGYSYSGISGDKTEAGLGENDYWVVKLTSSGSIEWQNTIGGNSLDLLYSLQQTADGGYILAGSSVSGISGDKTEVNIDIYNDYWIVKLDSLGFIEWENTIGGNSNDELRSIQQTTDGGYILGGFSSSGISGDKNEASLGLVDYWVVKVNSSGLVEWQKTIGGSSDDYLSIIQQVNDGGYILAGYSNSSISGVKTEANLGDYDFWVVKLSSIGLIEWQNSIGGSSADYLNCVQQTDDLGFILGGTSLSSISGDKTEALIGSGAFGGGDYWIIKLNTGGVIEWQNTIGGSSDDWLYSIQQANNGGYILGGHSNSSISGDKTENLIGGSYGDYWVVKLSSSGSIDWQNTIGGMGSDFLKSIKQTDDNGYILGGYSGTAAISGDKTETGLGSWDYWTVKLSPECIPTLESCNSIDDNCNGIIDDGVIETISISAGGSTSFCQGGSVVLSALHSGTSLQWKKNGVNIPGATSLNYTATQKATYTCQTTSICGTATSTGVFVNVFKNPNASITAGGATTFCAGGSVILTEAPAAGCTYQWYKGASPLVGATSTTYTATVSGNYKCRVIKTATGCYKNSNTITVSVTCKEGELGNHVNIYPNPASEIIMLEFNGVSTGTYEILNMSGQLMQTGNINSSLNEIDISYIAAGMYFLKLQTIDKEIISNFIKVD